MSSPDSPTNGGDERTARFKCLNCSTALDETAAEMCCPSCGKTWPIRDGVPRFFEPDYYWGEVPEEEAGLFLTEVREQGWRAAAGRRFADNENMRLGLTDWQRASWLALLGLPAGAVALDIGSGYGAITEAVSRGVGTLYSLEAIPERLEFTRLRLEQGGVRNVRMVQGTGLQLPFMDESFDLITVNGVLEWVGEWREHGSPRDVQLGFLRDIHRLLRPGGLLLVGIENRFGLQYLMGGRDHSGLAFTSLMPRWLASATLKLRGNYYRGRATQVRRSYRTYTYTQRGYRALLADGGFASSDFFWSEPGYNQPYNVIPLRGSFAADHFEHRLYEPSQSWRRGWKRSLKALVAKTPIVDFIAADFVIVAEKAGAPGGGSWRHRNWARLRAGLPRLPNLREPIFALSTRSFALKNLIRVFDAGASAPGVMLRASTAAPDSVDALNAEYRALETAARQYRDLIDPGFSMPEPLGTHVIGAFVYAAESAAPGRPLSYFVFSAGASDRRQFMARELARAVDVAIGIAGMLRGAVSIPAASASWRELPVELLRDGPLVRLAEEVRAQWERERDAEPWSHHGDFSIENIFSTSDSGELSVIDWEHLVRGAPALYDVVSLLISALPAVEVGGRAVHFGSEAWIERFTSVFFDRGPWMELYRDLLLQACRGLGVPESQAWPQFMQCLVMRANYFMHRGGRAQVDHMSFLRVAAELRERFLLPG